MGHAAIKIFLIILGILFIAGFVNGLKLGTTNIEFKGYANQKICEDATVYSAGKFLTESRWAEGYSRNLADYKIQDDRLGVNMDYGSIIDNNMKICLTAKHGGIYYGVVLFREENENEGIGIWIKADILGDIGNVINEENSSIRLSNDMESGGQGGLGVIMLLLSMIVLLVIFAFVLIRRKRRINIK